jgi:D-3-phosphoglycerate dehydrogenase / 2-oxoglutarate reductase
MTGSLDVSNLRKASVRGTVAENTLMISRINDFDKLYFEPSGYTTFFQYKDRPGVIGQIGAALARAQINIEDVRHSHHVPSDQSLAIFKVNKPVPDAVLRQIKADVEAGMAFGITL